MAFTADMYKGEMNTFYNEYVVQKVMLMDITGDGASFTLCQLEITQTIVQKRLLMISHSTRLPGISPSCLVR